jgi:hypothetical protein
VPPRRIRWSIQGEISGDWLREAVGAASLAHLGVKLPEQLGETLGRLAAALKFAVVRCRFLSHSAAKPYSVDLLARVIEDVETGASRREAAERYGISPSVVVIWVQRFEETGRIAGRWCSTTRNCRSRRASCWRPALAAGTGIVGPAVIEEPNSTTLIGVSDRASMNETGHYLYAGALGRSAGSAA